MKSHKKKAFLIAIGFLLILSAWKHEGSSQHNLKVKQVNKAFEIYQELDILAEKKSTHFFSDTTDKDEFHIYLKGKSILEAIVQFKITSPTGDVLLEEEFPSHYLIGYGLFGDEITDEKKEKYITNRISTFLDEENFLMPAIDPNELFDADYSDKIIWDDIKSDKNAIGFYYLVGEEDGRTIAFSKKMKKVVQYFGCC